MLDVETYGTLASAYYEKAVPKIEKALFDYYLTELNRNGGSTLEIMCGSGRITIPLFEQGIDIEGLDSSPQMIDLFNRKVCLRSNKPDLYLQKVEHMKLPRSYSSVIIPSASFGMLADVKVIKKSLNKIYECLKPGGIFYVDLIMLNDATKIEPQESYDEVEMGDRSKIVLKRVIRFEHTSGLESVECTYSKVVDGIIKHTEKENVSCKYFKLNEFKDLLKDSGFYDIEVMSGYTGRLATDKDSIILFKSRKR